MARRGHFAAKRCAQLDVRGYPVLPQSVSNSRDRVSNFSELCIQFPRGCVSNCSEMCIRLCIRLCIRFLPRLRPIFDSIVDPIFYNANQYVKNWRAFWTQFWIRLRQAARGRPIGPKMATDDAPTAKANGVEEHRMGSSPKVKLPPSRSTSADPSRFIAFCASQRKFVCYLLCSMHPKAIPRAIYDALNTQTKPLAIYCALSIPKPIRQQFTMR